MHATPCWCYKPHVATPIILTEEQKYRYIIELAQTGLRSLSAKAIAVGSVAVVNNRKLDPDFDAAVEEAMAQYRDLLEREVHRRGVEGWEEPVFNKGMLAMRFDKATNTHVPLTIRKYDSNLLSLHARRHIPQYREHYTVEAHHTGKVLCVPEAAFGPAGELAWEAEHVNRVFGPEKNTNGNGNGNGSHE